MTSARGHVAHTEPQEAREFLLTVAATLQEIASPDFRGDAAAMLAKCSLILVRVAQEIVPWNADFRRILAEKPGPAGEGQVLDALERQRSDLLAFVRSAKERHNFDAAGFAAYLRRHPLFTDKTRVVATKEATGGRAKRTVLFELDGTGHGPREMVLRQDMPSVFPRTSVSFEYPLLGALWDAGIKVPRPILMEANADALGGPFIMVQRLFGRTRGDLLSPPRDEGLALQLADFLGKLHALPTSRFAQLPGLVTKEYTTTQLTESLAWYRDVYERFDVPSETVSGAFSWLEQAVADVEGPLVLLHGDVGFHNILVDDGVITGVLDWEIAHFGNAAEEIGYCRDDVEMMIAWPRFVAAYRAAGGPEIDERALEFHALFGALKVYCSGVMTRPKVASGEIRDLGVTECIIDWVPALRQRMSRRLRAILRRG